VLTRGGSDGSQRAHELAVEVGAAEPLAAEPVWGLHQRDQTGGSNRTDAGNQAQQFRCLMFPALG